MTDSSGRKVFGMGGVSGESGRVGKSDISVKVLGVNVMSICCCQFG